MTDSYEKVMDDLRLHPDSRYNAIADRCEITVSNTRMILYRLLNMGRIKKFKYGNNDFRYSVVENYEPTSKKIPDYKKEAIRIAASIEEFNKSVIPMIKAMPGRTTFFYANLLGQSSQTTRTRLKKLEKLGIVISDKRRRKNMHNPLALWWIAGEQPDDLSKYVITDDIKTIRTKNEKIIKSNKIKIDSEDKEWMKEAIKTRQQRNLDEAMRNENQAPIPNYADYFRVNGG